MKHVTSQFSLFLRMLNMAEICKKVRLYHVSLDFVRDKICIEIICEIGSTRIDITTFHRAELSN